MQELLSALQPVLQAIAQAGGAPLIVGGAVRDVLLGLPAKDLDVEVYGLDADQLQGALAPLGRIDIVGRSFGVIKLRLPDRREVDVALPQRRSRSDLGGRGVLPTPDPSLTPREAAARRDFTWNSMAVTPDGALLDFFGGRQDLDAGLIRHTSAAFDEDPLRVLRAMQLAARFGFRLAPETAARCRGLLGEAASLPPERVWVEWQKWALRGRLPSAGLRALEESGWIAHYPELGALRGCLQEPAWHPEGDVWVHTGHVCDYAAQIAARDALADDQREVLLLSALCHDLGKPATTAADPQGALRSPGHADAGVEPAQLLLERIAAPRRVIAPTLRLVREHMSLLHAAPTERAVRRLAVRLEPATIGDWRRVVEADASGRPPYPPSDPGAPVEDLAERLGAATGRPAPLITGRDLLARGHQPGPEIGQILRRAYAAQIDGAFTTRDEGLAWLDAHDEGAASAS